MPKRAKTHGQLSVGADLINLQGDNVESGLNFGAPVLACQDTFLLGSP